MGNRESDPYVVLCFANATKTLCKRTCFLSSFVDSMQQLHRLLWNCVFQSEGCRQSSLLTDMPKFINLVKTLSSVEICAALDEKPKMCSLANLRPGQPFLLNNQPLPPHTTNLVEVFKYLLVVQFHLNPSSGCNWEVKTRQCKVWHPLTGGGGQSWPWPMTPWPKMNRVSLLIIHNLHVKFGSDWAKTVVCILPTRSYT